MDNYGVYKISGKYELKNIFNNSAITTADHDGFAIILLAQK
jgi:hypothetical protein